MYLYKDKHTLGGEEASFRSDAHCKPLTNTSLVNWTDQLIKDANDSQKVLFLQPTLVLCKKILFLSEANRQHHDTIKIF